jgi:hypothetical protein
MDARFIDFTHTRVARLVSAMKAHANKLCATGRYGGSHANQIYKAQANTLNATGSLSENRLWEVQRFCRHHRMEAALCSVALEVQ